MKTSNLIRSVSALLIAATLSTAFVPQRADAAVVWYFSSADTSTPEKYREIQHEKHLAEFGFLIFPLIGAISAFVTPITIPLGAGLVSAIMIGGVLDQKVDSVPALSNADLSNNGYTPSQISLIQSDEASFVQAMKDKKAMLALERDEDRQSIRSAIREVYPQASELFLEMKSEQLSLASQSNLAE